MGNRLTFPLASVFVALPLEGEAKWQFQSLQEDLRPFADFLHFQNPQSPHLTLMFWPEVLELEYAGIRHQLAAIAARTEPFSLMVNGVSTFGSRGRDQVLFLTVAFSPELALLKKSCPWSDGRAFNPHVTVARIAHPERFSVHRKEILKVFNGVSFALPVDRLRLYARVNGVRQTVIGAYPFGLQPG